MTGPGRTGARVALVTGATLLVVALVAALVLVAASGGDGGEGSDGGGTGDALTAPEPGAAGDAPAVERFLTDHVDDDGRVVRHDQGGDTVSEGQAYALLLAVAAGDEARFATVWSWTRDNLERPDRLFAWRWQDGQVVDDSPAADADLDIARALSVAADRFDRPELADDARRVATAVMDHETATVAGRRVLVAGPWAVADRVVNPSYLARCDHDDLAELTGDERWHQVGADSRELLGGLVDAGLPPDWAVVDDGGVARPVDGPDPAAGDSRSTASPPARYGPDAARIPVRLAACGSSEERDLAAALWPRLRRLADHGAGIAYALDGTPIDRSTHPLGLVGAAGAAVAAGDRADAEELLAEAEDLQAAQPTYYGAAWTAFGQLLLAGDRAVDTALPGADGQLVAARHPLQEQPTQPTTTTAPPTTAPPAPTTTSPSTTDAPAPTTGPTTSVAGSPTTAPTTSGGTTGGTGTGTTGSTGVTDSTVARPDASTTRERSDQPGEAAPAGELSAAAEDQPLPFPGDEADRGHEGRRATGALALGGFGTALLLGALLGLRERTLTRQPHRANHGSGHWIWRSSARSSAQNGR